MVPAIAKPEPDLRSVFTPINACKAEALLFKLNLHHKWAHIIQGLQEGFDVGIRESPQQTIYF